MITYSVHVATSMHIHWYKGLTQDAANLLHSCMLMHIKNGKIAIWSRGRVIISHDIINGQMVRESIE